LCDESEDANKAIFVCDEFEMQEKSKLSQKINIRKIINSNNRFSSNIPKITTSLAALSATPFLATWTLGSKANSVQAIDVCPRLSVLYCSVLAEVLHRACPRPRSSAKCLN
jgi:hypothetical protein